MTPHFCRLLLAALGASLVAAFALPPSGGAYAPAPKRELTNSVGMKLVPIPAGKFQMGAPNTEVGRNPEEGPQHEVEITKPFHMGAYEVTQAEYQKVTGTNPSYHAPTGGGAALVKGLDAGKLPVENVSWEDAVAFCKKLSDLPAEKAARREYRLPSEAEWEYACRAGTATPFAFGASLGSAQANFNGDSPYGEAPKGPSLGRTAPAGSYKPNAWGLYDMHGNVKEWTQDTYDSTFYARSPKKDPVNLAGDSRAIRGGAFINPGRWVRSADRSSFSPTGKLNYVGFRVVCVPAAPAR